MSEQETNIVYVKPQRNLGLWSLVLSLVGLFVFTFPLSFIAMILAIMGLFRGQVISSMLGLLLSLIGVASSVVFWAFVGLGALISMPFGFF